MATASIAGFKGIVKASTATGVATATIAEVRDFTLTMETDEIDVSTRETSGDRSFLGGMRRWSGSIEALSLSTNTGHQALYDVLKAGTEVDFDFFPTGSSSEGAWEGPGQITNWELGSPNDDAELVNVEIVGTSGLTRTSTG